jgi:hypothetical protein
VESVDEIAVIRSFHKFSADIITELLGEGGPYLKHSLRALFFKNDPPADYPDFSCKLHDFSIFICRPPSDTTYDLLRHYNMDISDSNIDWHISSYKGKIRSFLSRAEKISSEALASKVRMIEFPVFVTSPQARLALIAFITQDGLNLHDSLTPRTSEPKFNPEKSKDNIGHGSSLPPMMREKVEESLNPIYHELLDYCESQKILIKG